MNVGAQFIAPAWGAAPPRPGRNELRPYIYYLINLLICIIGQANVLDGARETGR